MPYPGRNRIYEKTIKRMVDEALLKQEKVFAEEHSVDSDVQLLAYVRSCADRLGHTPWPREIAGGSFLLHRFITWDNVLKKADLIPPSLPDKMTCFARFTEETERQKQIHREQKTRKRS